MASKELPATGSKSTSFVDTTEESKKADLETSSSTMQEENMASDSPPTNNDTATVAKEMQTAKDPEAEEEMEYPHGVKLFVILGALCLAVFLVALDQTIIATAIPRITDKFNSIKDIGWYGSAYLVTATALQPTFGRIYTIFSVSPPSSCC